MPSIVRTDATRQTNTPAAAMTTLMSPTLGGSSHLSLWQTILPSGSAGPIHAIDSEQIWTLLDGRARCTVDDETVTLQPGDTICFPAGSLRRIATDETLPDGEPIGARFLVCGHADALATTPTSDHPVSPPWIS